MNLGEITRSSLYCDYRDEPCQIKGYKAPILLETTFLILNEIPSRNHDIYISGYNQVFNQDEIINENDYWVDYIHGLIYFHESKMGQKITIDEYFGLGNMLIDATRVVTKVDDKGNIVQVLEDLLEAYPNLIAKLEEAIELCERMELNIEKINELWDKVTRTQNPSFTINDTQWILDSAYTEGTRYYYNLTHGCDSYNLIVTSYNQDTNLSMGCVPFETTSENDIRVYTTAPYNAKIIVNASYYHGFESLDTTVVQEVEDSRMGEGSLAIKIAKMTNKDEELDKKIDDVTIGARNYLLNTGLKKDTTNFTGISSSVVRTTDKLTPSGNYCFYTNEVNHTSNVWAGATQYITTNFQIGDTFTFSIWTYIPSDHESDGNLCVEVIGGDSSSERTFTKRVVADKTIVDEWVRYSVMFTVPENTVKLSCWSYVTKNGKWYTGDYKLEKGNKPTDWTPNPEDFVNEDASLQTQITANANDIATNATNITTNANNITTNKNNISALTTKFNDNRIFSVSSLTELNEALTSATQGTQIKIKSGKYTVDTSFEIPKGVTISGSGINNCIFDCSSTSIDNVFRNKLDGTETGYNTFDIIIEGINFNGYDTVSTVTVVAFGHAMNVQVRDCMFQRFNTWHNIELNGCQYAYLYRNRFSNYGNTSGGNPTEVIQLDFMRDSGLYPWTANYDNTACRNIYIENNSFYNLNCTATGVIGAHSIDYVTSDIHILNNKIDTVGNFFYLPGAKDIFIMGNYGTSVNNFVKFIVGNSRTMNNIIITNNNITGTGGSDWTVEGRFIYSSGEASTNGVTIIGNTIRNFNSNAIGFTGNSVVINGNIIDTCGRCGIYWYGGTDWTISNNIVTNTDKVGAGYQAIRYGGNTGVTADFGLITCNKGTVAAMDNVGSNIVNANNLLT